MNAKQAMLIVFVLTISLMSLGCRADQLFEATITPTSTKKLIPTATSTTRKIPTKIPRPTPTLPINIPGPQVGKGIVFGKVLNGGRPAPNMQVRLCSKYTDSLSGVCGSGVKYESVTDNNGYFIFSKVAPGRYEVLVVLLPNMYIKYWTFKLDIKAGETENFGSIDIE